MPASGHELHVSVNCSWVPTPTFRTSGRALHCCKKNLSNSMCLVLRVEPLRWIMLMASVERKCDGNGFGSTVSRPPNFRSDCHSCLSPFPSHAPDNATTISASPLLGPIIGCFLLFAVMEYQLCFPRIHDAVPLTLCDLPSQNH